MGAADNIFIGMFIGMVMSVPFGAVGVICIKRILSRGKVAGLASGLGVAMGDSLFASIVVFGVTQLSEWIVTYQRPIEFAGGLLILLAGVCSYIRYRQQQGAEMTPDNLSTGAGRAFSDTVSMMLMTMAYPQTIIGFSAAFAATVRFYHLETTMDSVFLVVGVFLGGISWWIGLSFGLDRLRERLEGKLLYSLHQAAAVLVTAVGLLIMAHALFFSDMVEIAQPVAG